MVKEGGPGAGESDDNERRLELGLSDMRLCFLGMNAAEPGLEAAEKQAADADPSGEMKARVFLGGAAKDGEGFMKAGIGRKVMKTGMFGSGFHDCIGTEGQKLNAQRAERGPGAVEDSKREW